MTFPTGPILLTAAVNDWLTVNRQPKAEDDRAYNFVARCIIRHANADWGDLDEEDAAINNNALSSGEGRLMSSYNFKSYGIEAGNPLLPPYDDTLWIITENIAGNPSNPDELHTTVLFPSDY